MAEVRDLLAAATPRPWFIVGPPWNVSEPWICTSDDPHAGHFIADLDGDLAESLEDRDLVADAELIVRAVNEYEALIALEDAVRDNERRLDETGYSDGDDIGCALARLDEVRGG